MPKYEIIFTATINGRLRTKKKVIEAMNMIKAVEKLRWQFQVEKVWSIEVKK